MSFFAQAAREAAAVTLLDFLTQDYGSCFFGPTIYGSTARGMATVACDLDFTICADHLPGGRFCRIEEFDRRIEWPLREEWESRRGCAPIDLSPIFRNPSELMARSPILFDVTKDARILRDENGHIAKALDCMRARFERSGPKRVSHRRLSWWDLRLGLACGGSYEL